MENSKIAYAVALALGTVSAAHAAAPTVAQCQGAPAAQIYVAGSSAAQAAFGDALAVGLFGGTANQLTFSATNGNFEAFCGLAANTNAGTAVGALVVVHYRAEGGSVSGALPIVAPSHAIRFLDLTNAAITGLTPNTANVVSVTTTGSTATVGTTDGFGGPLTTHLVEMGVTDVEPGQLFGVNYPKDYSTTVFGTATQAQLAALPKKPLFQQVFGIVVNTAGLTLTGGTVNLSKPTVANILLGNYGDFSSVPTNGGSGVAAAASQAITLVNREEGSGTRTGAGIYFLGTQCGAPSSTGNAILDPTGATDYFSTGDVLKQANITAGAVTYASIDQLPSTKYPNLVFASINGNVPSNLAAANGDYDYWFEAQMITGATPTAPTLFSYIQKTLPAVASAPKVKDILAIPNVASNAASVPVTGTGSPAIYVNPFTKNNNSCSIPTETN